MKVTETKRDKASAKRRQHILETAVTCFLENGYHQTGLREIAKRAGVSLGNLYNHFPGKHDILAEIAAIEREEMAPILEMLARDAPAGETLTQFVDDYTAILASPDVVILTLEITCEAMRKPDIAELFAESRAALEAALIMLIERGIKAGELRAVPEVAETAHLLIDLIEGGAYRIAIEEVPKKRVLENLKALVTASLINTG
ncbi:MAG: TetR/AcrR family transcriptional regulator [Pseudomonadota bacterium]